MDPSTDLIAWEWALAEDLTEVRSRIRSARNLLTSGGPGARVAILSDLDDAEEILDARIVSLLDDAETRRAALTCE